MAVSDMTGGSFDKYDQHLVAGGELLRQTRVDEAKREFLAALELKPNDSKALALLGLACFRSGAFREALPVYEQLVVLNPGDASFQLNLGLVHLKLGNARFAIDSLARSRDLDPSQGRAVSYLGLAYARAGQYAEAYQAFLQARQTDLAREMEQYLSVEVREAIAATVNVPPAKPEAAPAAAAAPVEPARAAAAPPAEAPKPARAERQPEIDLDADDDVEIEFATIGDDGGAGTMATAPREPAPVISEPIVTRASTSSGPVIKPRNGSVRAETTGAISQAVARALPSSAAVGSTARVAPGNRPPMPLSEFATSRLIRPDEGENVFEISAGGVLIVRVTDKVYARTVGVDVTGGQLTYEVASRRNRGANTGEAFSSEDGSQMFIVTGHGHMIAAPLGGLFTAVTLDDDILYLREDLVFAFEPDLRWENGSVPGSAGKLHMVQFRGTGSVAFRTARPLLAIKLATEKVLYIDATALAGWIGRVVPRVVSPVGGGQSELFVECSGEGVVLIEEEQTVIGLGAAVAGATLEAVSAAHGPTTARADAS